MTLLDPEPLRADYRRDRWGRPLVVPADGGAPKPYTRASSAAKTIEDTFNLEQWARRNVAFGLAHDASLVARILALGGTPSTWTDEQRKAAQKVCDDAANIAQAHKSADIGTALHLMVERINLGETVTGGPYQADLDAYRQAVADMGWTIDPAHVECRMVCDALEMAGTADLIIGNTLGHHIADLKTGKTVTYSGLGYAAQLAAYAGGDLYDPADDTRPAMPELDRRLGYIIHLPAGQGVCTIYDVDLERGWEAARLANEVRTTRKHAKQWLQVAAPTPSPVVEQPVGAVATSATAPANPPQWGHGPDDGPMVGRPAIDTLIERVRGSGHRDVINAWVAEGSSGTDTVHTKWNPMVRGSERAIAITEAAMSLASLYENDVIRAVIATAISTDAAEFPTIPIGHILGQLRTAEARLIVRLVDAMTGDGGALLTFDNDTGQPVIVADIAALRAA